eukprot:scaffold381_cov168-Ochromonas_danica.AAC.31
MYNPRSLQQEGQQRIIPFASKLYHHSAIILGSSSSSSRWSDRVKSGSSRSSSSRLALTSKAAVSSPSSSKTKPTVAFPVIVFQWILSCWKWIMSMNLFQTVKTVPFVIPKNQDDLLDIPFYIFINSNSGGKNGRQLLQSLQAIVKSDYICDLHCDDPKVKLRQAYEKRGLIDREEKKVKVKEEEKKVVNSSTLAIEQPDAVLDDYLLPHTSTSSSPPCSVPQVSSPSTVHVLCCGGDGTMRWVMDEAKNLNLSQAFCYSLVPMGTGNDLYNHLFMLYQQQQVKTKKNKREGRLLNLHSLLHHFLPTLQKFFFRSRSQHEMEGFSTTSSNSGSSSGGSGDDGVSTRRSANNSNSSSSEKEGGGDSGKVSSSLSQSRQKLIESNQILEIIQQQPFDRWKIELLKGGQQRGAFQAHLNRSLEALEQDIKQNLDLLEMRGKSGLPGDDEVDVDDEDVSDHDDDEEDDDASLPSSSSFSSSSASLASYARSAARSAAARAAASAAAAAAAAASAQLHQSIIIKRERAKKFLRSLRVTLQSRLLSYFVTKRAIYFNNYFGIGVDGDIAHSYHNLRKAQPYLFFNRIINQALYGAVWIYKAIRSDNKLISNYLSLYCDGKKVDLSGKDFKGIIFSNIRSYAGGSELWPEGDELQRINADFKPVRSDDSLLEVVGIYGLTHLAQIKAGIAKAVPLAQGRSFKVETRTRVAMQVDGEPWIQSSCDIDISLAEKVCISVPTLSNPKTVTNTPSASIEVDTLKS